MTDEIRFGVVRDLHRGWIILVCLVLASYELLKWRAISADQYGEFLLRTLCFSPVVVRFACSLFVLLGLLWFLVRKSSHKAVVVICEVVLAAMLLGMLIVSYLQELP